MIQYTVHLTYNLCITHRLLAVSYLRKCIQIFSKSMKTYVLGKGFNLVKNKRYTMRIGGVMTRRCLIRFNDAYSWKYVSLTVLKSWSRRFKILKWLELNVSWSSVFLFPGGATTELVSLLAQKRPSLRGCVVQLRAKDFLGSWSTLNIQSDSNGGWYVQPCVLGT